jgi:hypothetical protein
MSLLIELLQVIFFVWLDNSVDKFISNYISNGMMNIIEIIDTMFSDDIFLSTILMVIALIMRSGFKY